MNKENSLYKKHFKDYIIVGDFEIYGKIESCLIRVCGEDKKHAEEILDRMLNNPNKDDLYDLNKPNFRGNLHIEVEYDGWWNDPYYTKD